MAELILCKLCGQRRAKRACPAVQGNICSICCGTEREVSLACPLDCEYLREAHRREKPLPVEPKDVFDRDIEVSETFVRSHEELLLFCVYSLVQAALRTPGAVDTDVIAALQALVKTHRTTETGLFYETRPENSLAAGVQRAFSDSLADYQKIKVEQENETPVRNTELLTMLVFLGRIGQQNTNGRPRGRMFVDMLSQMTPSTGVEERAPSIIL
ncbi:MAG TPA: hypothetical protein VK604_00585 [Bryobacteraceae bacterium]|nr:hypothetical protein [Bryobacteraceae bacterium]